MRDKLGGEVGWGVSCDWLKIETRKALENEGFVVV